MSLARYLANLLNSSGQVEAAKLAATLDLSSKTLTYPDNSVQSADIASLAASKLSGQVPDANAPSGSVIQVVQAFKQDTFSVNTNTWTNITGLNVNITPLSSSNRILIISNIFGHSTGNAFLRMTRNGTVIGVGTQVGSREGVAAGDLYSPDDNRNQTFSMMYVDSPSSTSSVSYWAQTRAEQASGFTTYINRQTTDSDSVNRPRYASMLIAMEVAA